MPSPDLFKNFRFVVAVILFCIPRQSIAVGYDTLIIDSSYISIEFDTGNIVDESDTLMLPSSDIPMVSARRRYFLSLSSDLLYNINSQMATLDEFDLLENSIPARPLSNFHRKLSMHASARLNRFGATKKFRKSSLTIRNGFGLETATLKFPVSSAVDSENLLRDSIVNAAVDGNDILMTYFQSFDQGVGELDTVFEPWQRKILKWQLLGFSLSAGLEYQRLNSPWVMSMDLSMYAMKILQNNKNPSLGMISNENGYFEVDESMMNAKGFVNYSITYSLERLLPGISDGLFKGSRLGLRISYTSPVKINFQAAKMERTQLGCGLFFSIPL